MNMEETGESETRESRCVSVQMSGVSGDLLQRMIAGSHISRKFEEAGGEETAGGIELSLGLSLNGRFGVDPKKAKMLTRSSSISNFMTPLRYQDTTSTVVPITALTRTCSLPMETEEDWRKRKELQMLRRMEAKRKRSAKLRSCKASRSRDRDRDCLDDNCEEDKVLEDKPAMGSRTGNHLQQPCLSIPSRTKGGSIPSKTERTNGLVPGVGSGGLEGHAPPLPPLLPSSQGSAGSQKCCSSGISEYESPPVQGVSKSSEARSPASIRSISDQGEQKPIISPLTPEKPGKVGVVLSENQPKKPIVSNGEASEMERKVMEDMPCVSTTGDGPNGRKVDGFLYRYNKGEEVRIVCVCHGSFLTPAEFVKHAGGSDVAHPLRHIVVCPSSLL